MSDTHPNSRPDRDQFMIYGGIVAPSTAAVVCFLWLVSQRSRLPDSIATHWTSGDTPDGFMTPMQSFTTLLVLTIACAQIGWFGVPTKIPVVHRRLLFVINIVLAAFLIGLQLGVTIPQIGSVDPATASINVAYPAGCAAAGLALSVVGMRYIRDFDREHPEFVTSRPAAKLPRGPQSNPASVTAGAATKIFLIVWVIGGLALYFVNPFLTLTLLLCLPMLMIGYCTGIAVTEGEVVIFSGVGPMKLTQRIDIRTISGAYASHYHWGDGGGVGLRIGNDNRITAAARSGEAVKFDTTTTGYTVVVPDGESEAIAADINSHVDTWLDSQQHR